MMTMTKIRGGWARVIKLRSAVSALAWMAGWRPGVCTVSDSGGSDPGTVRDAVGNPARDTNDSKEDSDDRPGRRLADGPSGVGVRTDFPSRFRPCMIGPAVFLRAWQYEASGTNLQGNA